MLGVIPLFAFRRLKARSKPLPPSFLLLAFGLLHAGAGAFLLAFTRMGMRDFPLFETARGMVQLGFPLCMVLGVTAKLAPFLTGHVDAPPNEEKSVPPGFPAGQAAIHGAVGALLLAGFIAEGNFPRLAGASRAVLATAHMLAFARIGRAPLKRTAAALLFWTSCWMIPAGLWLMALAPEHRVAFEHVVFIGGFSLMIFSFGLLVVLTHTAQAAALKGPMTALKAAAGLVGAALVFRVGAEFFPTGQMPLLFAASVSWVAAASVWGGYVLAKTAGG
jgi:hypothetical protein